MVTTWLLLYCSLALKLKHNLEIVPQEREGNTSNKQGNLIATTFPNQHSKKGNGCLAQAISWTNADLTHWGRVTHICVGKLTNIDSDNGLSPERRQAIIWTNAGILLFGPLGTNFSEFLIGIHTFHSRKCLWKCRLRNGGHFVSTSMC